MCNVCSNQVRKGKDGIASFSNMKPGLILIRWFYYGLELKAISRGLWSIRVLKSCRKSARGLVATFYIIVNIGYSFLGKVATPHIHTHYSLTHVHAMSSPVRRIFPYLILYIHMLWLLRIDTT